MRNITEKKRVIHQTILIAVLFILLVGFSSAWFVFSQKTSTSDLTLETMEAQRLEISLDESEWDNEIIVDFEENVKLYEASGDGLDMFIPVYIDKTIPHFEKVDASDVCLEKTINIRSNTPTSIYLGNDSLVIPNSLSTGGNVVDIEDYIAGAVRVGFYEVTETSEVIDGVEVITKTPEKRLIWAPNSQYHYDNSTVNENGNVEGSYVYQNGIDNNSKITINTNNTNTGYDVNNFYFWSNDLANANDISPVILEFSEEEYTDPKTDEINNNDVVKTLLIRIWIEGHDREAVPENYQGQVKIKLEFETTEGRE